jgi:hypothetical protein
MQAMEPATSSPEITRTHLTTELDESGDRISFPPNLVEIESRSCHPVLCAYQGCPTCRHTALGIYVWTMGYWETILEDAIVHEMRMTPGEGNQGPSGRVPFADREDALRTLRETLYDEETGAVLEGASARGYILLHDPELVCAVADHWVLNSRVSAVVGRNHTKIENLISIRHAAAHASPRTRHLLEEPMRYFGSQGGEDDTTEVGAFLLTKSADGQLMLAYLLSEVSELTKAIQTD